MPRDILKVPQYEVRLAVTPPPNVGDTATEPENPDDPVQLEVISTEPKQETEPRELLAGEVAPEGEEPHRTVETSVPLSRERALAIFSERSAGRDLRDGEGVFEVVKRENGDIHRATRIDAGATDANARAASKQTVPGGEQPQRAGQTAPVPSPTEDVPVQPTLSNDAKSVGENQPTVAPGNPPATPKRRDR